MSLLDHARGLALVLAACCLFVLATSCATRDDGIALSPDAEGPTSPPTDWFESPVPDSPPAPYPAADWDWRPDGREWTEMAHVALVDLGSGLLTTTPRDIADYCPSYERLNDESRRAFWVYLLSRLARFESNHDPGVSFTESFNDSQGNPVISRGLLQISKESANGYGCRIVDADELYDPEGNIRCGVRILNRWVAERDGVIAGRTDGQWLGAARYWSPFRNESRRAEIAVATASQSYCQ
jgi:hypothetical protein